MGDNSIYLHIPIKVVYDENELKNYLRPILDDVGLHGEMAKGLCESWIHEAINNAADHGILGMQEKDKDLRARLLEDPEYTKKVVSLLYVKFDGLSYSINVDDGGQGFNHEKIFREIREREENPPKTYLGLRMMKKLSDMLYFNELGNNVTMIKFFDNL